MDVRIQVKGVDELARNLRDLGVNRIPSYVARALTGLANEGQDAMERNMRENLTVRGTWATRGYKYSIKRKQAYKHDLSAEVYTEAPWLYEQETKTELTPRKASALATPSKSLRPSRLADVVIPSSLRPRKLKDAFKVRTRYGNEAIYRRMGRGRVSYLVLMYVLRRKTHEARRVHLVQFAVDRINARMRDVLTSMLDQAIKERGA